MLLYANAAHVVAVEPSAAFEVLRENTSSRSDRITYLRGRAESLPPDANLDLVVSIGVLHHIPEPMAAVEAAWGALRPGGHILIWLYGREGNELYLRFVGSLRAVAAHLPHRLLAGICRGLNVLLDIYMFLCRYLPLPMRKYMREVLGRLPRRVRELTIYDQLNPAYVKYYTRTEAEGLLKRAGFVEVRAWHRHGYSWSVTGRRPEG
jgi:SAM-dependent methyltransferase